MTLGKIYIGNDLYVDSLVIINALGVNPDTVNTWQELADLIIAEKQTLVAILAMGGIDANSSSSLQHLADALKQLKMNYYPKLGEVFNDYAFINSFDKFHETIETKTCGSNFDNKVHETFDDLSFLEILKTFITTSGLLYIFGNKVNVMTSNTTCADTYKEIISNVIPQTFTSNTGDGITLFDNGHYSDHGVFRLFDGTGEHYGWESNIFTSSQVNAIVGAIYNEPIALNRYSLYGCIYYTERCPKTWTFEGSNDTTTGLDGTWTILDTQTNVPVFTSWKDCVINGPLQPLEVGAPDNEVKYKAYRINISANNGDGTYTQFALASWDHYRKDTYHHIGTAFADTESANYKAFKAMTGTVTDGTDAWVTNGSLTGILGYIFDNEFAIYDYLITARNSSEGGAQAPKTWTLEGSNDTTTGLDGTWDIVDTKTNITGFSAGSTKSFTIGLTTVKYKAYRLNITANNGSLDVLSIGDLQIRDNNDSRQVN